MRIRTAAVLCIALCVQYEAFGVEIQSEGYGETVSNAVAQARQQAVDTVAGSFVVSTTVLDNDVPSETVRQYSGGLVKSTKVISVTSDGKLYHAVVLVDVDDRKINSRIPPSSVPLDVTDALKKSIHDYNQTREVVETLDHTTAAYGAAVSRVSMDNAGSTTTVRVEYTIALNPKWIDDVRVLARTVGRPIVLDHLMGGVLRAFGADAALSKDDPSREPIVCFSDKSGWYPDNCWETRHSFDSLRKGIVPVKITIRTRSGDIVKIEKVPTQNVALQKVLLGEVVYFNKSNKEMRFVHPGLMVYEADTITTAVDIDISSDLLMGMSDVTAEVL